MHLFVKQDERKQLHVGHSQVLCQERQSSHLRKSVQEAWRQTHQPGRRRGHSDMAKILYNEYGEEFVFSTANGVWYRFVNHIWRNSRHVRCDSSERISETVTEPSFPNPRNTSDRHRRNLEGWVAKRIAPVNRSEAPKKKATKTTKTTNRRRDWNRR